LRRRQLPGGIRHRGVTKRVAAGLGLGFCQRELPRSEARDMKATDNFNNSILSSVAG